MPDGSKIEVSVCSNEMCRKVALYSHRVGKLGNHKNPQPLIDGLCSSFEELLRKQLESMSLRMFLHLVVLRDAREFGISVKPDGLTAKDRRSYQAKLSRFLETFELLQRLAKELWPPTEPKE